MSSYWKLKIDDYSLDELEQLFELKMPYTLESIVNNDEKFKKQIKQDDKMDDDNKKEIMRFLDKAKELLIQNAKKQMGRLRSSQVYGGTSLIREESSAAERGKTNVNTLESYLGQADGGASRASYQRIISIDSQFRNDYYNTLSTDFLLDLPFKVTDVVSMQLSGLEFPNTYFQISKSTGNNFFWLGWQKEVALVLNWYFIDIPDGSYTRTSMQDEINTQTQKATGLDSENCPQCSIDHRSNRCIFALPTTIANPAAFLQLAFNRTRGPYTITDASQNNFSPAPLDPATHISKNLGWILGFRLAEYKASTAYVSEGMYDTWGIKYVYVVVDDFNKNFINLIEPIYNNSLGRRNILGRVVLSPIISALQAGTALADQLQVPGTRSYFGPVDIDKLRITITDQFGRVLNLNNMDLSLSVTLTCLYA